VRARAARFARAGALVQARRGGGEAPGDGALVARAARERLARSARAVVGLAGLDGDARERQPDLGLRDLASGARASSPPRRAPRERRARLVGRAASASTSARDRVALAARRAWPDSRKRAAASA